MPDVPLELRITVPLELRIRTAILVRLFLALLWLGSWLRFLWMALEDGTTVAALDRQFWLHAMTVAMLDEMQRTAQQGVYPVRVIRAVLAPYYPKEHL